MNLKYVTLGALVIGAVVGGWLVFAPSLEEAEVAQMDQGPSFEQQFEDVLNTLLRKTAEKAGDYKMRRRVLAELVKPENLITPEYIQENHEMVQELVPELRSTMEEIMGAFSRADMAVKTLVRGQTPEQSSAVLKEWARLKADQAGAYILFFETEDGILSAYEELMALYFDTQGRFALDAETQEMVFEHPQDELNIQAKRRALQALLQEQASILGKE